VALWAVFAAASVGVGFGAAGLVGSTPFANTGSDTRDSADIGRDFIATAPNDASSTAAASPSVDQSATGQGSPKASSKSASPRPSASSQATSAPGSSPAGSKSSKPGRRSPAASPAKPRSTSSTPKSSGGGAQPTETRGSVATAGGFVSGSCRSGLVALSASPAVGWTLDGVTAGRTAEGEVEFEQSGETDAKVKVRARCAAGGPKFSVENIAGGGGGTSGSGGGGGDDG
jgi:hypothetical protein